MVKDEERTRRMEDAIRHLMAIGLIDNKIPSKCIAEKMNRGINSISSAINGDPRYLTWKFTKAFCAAFSNVVSAEWIWDGVGEMAVSATTPKNNISIPEELLMKLSREELVFLVKQLIVLHSEQTEMYRMLIKQNEQMIHNGQERINSITNIIFKNV